MEGTITESINSRIARLNLSQVGRNINQPLPSSHSRQQNRSSQIQNVSQNINVAVASNSTTANHWLPVRLPIIAPPAAQANSSTSTMISQNNLSPTPSVPANNTLTKTNNNNHVVHSTSQTTNCLECRDFSLVDAHAAKFPRQNVTSIRNLALSLTSPFPSKTDKARAIFTWLHHNIAYDTVAFFGNNIKSKTPEETLKSGLSVCQGYAELFAELGLHSNLEVLVISGHGKGYGYTQSGTLPSLSQLKNHAWNGVRLDSGKWQLIDSCWGAGHTDHTQKYQKRFTPSHFTASPEIFRLKHFPTDHQKQFCAIPMSWEEYIMMKDGPLLYSGFTDMGFSEITVQPRLKFITPGPGPTKFLITTRCNHMSIPPNEQFVLLLTIDGNHTHFQVDPLGTTWTCESKPNAIRQGSSVSVNILTKLGNRDGKGISVQEYLRLRSSSGMTFNGLCKWEVR